ncbi:MAG TPA: hypothetical protein QF730_09635 [Planctomycetota bacterium]|jgi:hypothetical protein|nr:hypothetical protein [Planctomycetota bacterium]
MTPSSITNARLGPSGASSPETPGDLQRAKQPGRDLQLALGAVLWLAFLASLLA